MRNKQKSGPSSRAFTFKSAIRASKSIRRTIDIKQKQLHAPELKCAQYELPPLVVAVMGPPKVGKSTLIAGLVKQITQQSLSCVQGPITIVSGKEWMS